MQCRRDILFKREYFSKEFTSGKTWALFGRFASVQQRPGVRMVVSDKFIEAFNWYESDLEEIQQVYEKFKVSRVQFVAWR